jgi:hypothetical protein
MSWEEAPVFQPSTEMLWEITMPDSTEARASGSRLRQVRSAY